MKPATRLLHEKFKQLGNKLGFLVDGEVSDSILQYRINEGYRPRIDIIWSLKLSRLQQKSIVWALGAEKLDTLLLPIVGIEIERSSPTTKTRQADLANLLSVGMPLGIIATAENDERGGYRRTARVIFSMKNVFGTINAIPFEEKWMERFLKQKWPSGECEITDIHSKRPGGGEKGWGKSVRKSLRRKGEASGFTVVESFIPPILQTRYNLALELASKPFKYTWDPINRETREATSAKNYLTGCEIDLVWTFALFEHEYAVPIIDDEWKRIADDMEQCLRNFYNSETFSMLKELPQQMWLEVEDFSSFNLNNTKIWAVLDCSFRIEEGGITIIDWKTGRSMSEDVSMQLSCYAMYALEKWGVDPEKVKLIEYNLLANQGAEFTVGSAEVENTKAYIAGSIADMLSLLVDVNNNVPKEEAAFQKVEDERTRTRCNFRKVCG